MTNEQMCQFIAEGDSNELVPLLWEKVRKLYHMLCEQHYNANMQRAKACGVELADCRQESYFAFLAALNDYNKEPRKVMFTSFANFHVKNQLNALFGMRTQRARYEPLNNSQSLEKPLANDNDTLTLMDTVEDIQALDGFDRVEQNDVYRVVRECVNQLEGLHKQVIIGRFYETRSLKDISEQLGKSSEYIRRSQNNELLKLQRMKPIREIGSHLYYSGSYGSYKRTGLSSVELAVERLEQMAQENREWLARYTDRQNEKPVKT